MDLSAELKELRKQLYTYRYKSLELERQLRTHCHTFHQSLNEDRQARRGGVGGSLLPNNGMFSVMAAFQDTSSSFVGVFTNSLIMEIIANHLPVQDLLRCRLVCKLWAREMAQYLTKRKALVVAYEDCSEAREIIKKKEQGKFVNISTLCILEIPVTSQIIQDIIRNFGETLSGLKLDDCNPEARDLFKLLQSITSLEVLSFKQTGVRRAVNRAEDDDEHDSSSESDSDSEVDEIPLPQALQQAVVRRRARRMNGPGNPRRNPPSKLDGLTDFCRQLKMPTVKKLVWEEMKPVKHVERIVTMFPCLEELELLCWAKPDPEKMKGLRMEHLKQLTISCDNNFSEEHFLALANLQLKLKKLTLHDIKPGGRRKMRGFKLFLESVAGTLEEMNLTGSGRLYSDMMGGLPPPVPRLRGAVRGRQQGLARNNANLHNSTKTRIFSQKSSPFPIEFPNLQRMEIDCSLLTDLKSLDGMPKLQKLECKMGDWKGWWHLLNRNGVPKVQHQKLRDLTLGAIDGGCLRRMVPCFRQVTKLDVNEDRIDDVAFRTICHMMQQLSHLRITQSSGSSVGVVTGTGVEGGEGERVRSRKMLRMTDKGITGMEDETCKELRDRLPEVEADQEEIKKRRKYAHIGNLRSLYSLELAMSEMSMSDVGIIYGIANLRRISTITLPKCELTDASLAVLSDMPSLLVLELHKSCGVSPEAVQALKQKKKDLVFNLYSDLTARIFS